MIEGPYTIDGMDVGWNDWATHMEEKLRRVLRIGQHHTEQDLASGTPAVANMAETSFLRVLLPGSDPLSRSLTGESVIVGEDVLYG
jgi:hypothetical protein